MSTIIAVYMFNLTMYLYPCTGAGRRSRRFIVKRARRDRRRRAPRLTTSYYDRGVMTGHLSSTTSIDPARRAAAGDVRHRRAWRRDASSQTKVSKTGTATAAAAYMFNLAIFLRPCTGAGRRSRRFTVKRVRPGRPVYAATTSFCDRGAMTRHLSSTTPIDPARRAAAGDVRHRRA
jgi:hypothetical protein